MNNTGKQTSYQTLSGCIAAFMTTARAKGPKGKQGSQITSKLSAYMYFCFSFFHASKPTDNNEDRLLVTWIEVVCDCRRILSMLACVMLSNNEFQSSLSPRFMGPVTV